MVAYNLILATSIEFDSVIAIDIIQKGANMAQSHQNSLSAAEADLIARNKGLRRDEAHCTMLTQAFLILLQIQK